MRRVEGLLQGARGPAAASFSPARDWRKQGRQELCFARPRPGQLRVVRGVRRGGHHRGAGAHPVRQAGVGARPVRSRPVLLRRGRKCDGRVVADGRAGLREDERRSRRSLLPVPGPRHGLPGMRRSARSGSCPSSTTTESDRPGKLARNSSTRSDRWSPAWPSTVISCPTGRRLPRTAQRRSGGLSRSLLHGLQRGGAVLDLQEQLGPELGRERLSSRSATASRRSTRSSRCSASRVSWDTDRWRGR